MKGIESAPSPPYNGDRMNLEIPLGAYFFSNINPILVHETKNPYSRSEWGSHLASPNKDTGG